MGRLDHGRAGEALGFEARHGPDDGGAPIVACDMETLAAERARQREDVGGGEVEFVGVRPLGLARQIVAALVRRDHVKAALGERREIVAPGEPEFWKSVQQDDQRAVFGAGRGAMKGDAVDLDEAEREEESDIALDPFLRARLERSPPAPNVFPRPFSTTP